MANDILFPELETDAGAIAAFDKTQISATEDLLCDESFEADVELIAQVLEDKQTINGVTRRGAWLYSYERDADHPRGQWRRVPDGAAITADADWQVVFDLDAFCAETGEDWHWAGVATLDENPSRVLVHLSFQGSDQTRHLEWDCDTAAPVAGGFDLPPARSSASWLDPDTILLSTSYLPGAATRSGWPGRVLRLQRGSTLEAAPTEFEVKHTDLTVHAYRLPLREGGHGIGLRRIRNIGDSVSILRFGEKEITLAAPRNTDCIHNDRYYAYLAADDGPDPAGTLVLDRLEGGARRVLFTPAPRQAVQAHSIIFDHNYMFWIETDTMAPTLKRVDLRLPDADPVTIPIAGAADSIALYPHDATNEGTGPLQLRTGGFLQPDQVWLIEPDIDPEAPEFTLLHAHTSSFDSTGMQVKLHLAKSADGTEVPYHIVLPAAPKDPVPVLQYGYGGFGVALSPNYQKVKGPAWLAKGCAYVQAYIRGGAEFGNGWHLAAKGDKRLRAYEDFAAVAEDIVKRGYSTPSAIGCHGGSNGGLLCGVMLTRYPRHFGAVWASVGVLDMLRYHLFPAGAGWIDEYGDPDDPEARAWLLEYSPLHNIAPADQARYPAALIDTNDSDDRVDPSHSRRFAAALQAAGQPALFHSRSGGHGGGGRSDAIAREQALGFAFLRKHLSI